MRIKEILIQTFTTPFANLVAIANLSMFAVVGAFGLVHDHSEFAALVHKLNAPAFIASVIVTGSFKMTLLVPLLIYLQWIFIGAFAKFVAFHMRPNNGSIDSDPSF